MRKLSRFMLFLFAVVALAACDTESSTMVTDAQEVDRQELLDFLIAERGMDPTAATILAEAMMLEDHGLTIRVAQDKREYKDLDIVRRVDLPDGGEVIIHRGRDES